MKLIIELSENDYKALQEDGVQNHLALADTIIANSIHYEEKPKGEWIVSQTMDCHSDIVNVYTCPFCGKREYSAYPFCHCGAELKGGAE